MHKIFRYQTVLLFLILILSCNQREKGIDEKQANTQDTVAARPVKTIVFFGNSLTAGYGLDPTQAFPALIQHKIDSQNLAYKVVNAGVSGETSSGGNSRVDWILEQ